MIEAALEQVEALDSASLCAQELSKIYDVNRVLKEEIRRLCAAATLSEITKVLFLTRQMKKTSGQKREPIKSQLKKIAEQVVTRAESQLGPLTLPETCQHLLLEL